ncbi:MAG: LacI family DNA-binding transcriptional regulator [Anaerolineaceae bacterium]|nr:LacI family DNA-binding transcriptional regulator [Anaerolineaceae bacterium]
MTQTTIKDVAVRAGVSKTTVSHVINKTRFVEEETRQKVLLAIDELQFRVNTAARSLTTKRTETLGIVISDSSNHFFGELLRSIDEVIRPQNYSLIICNTNEILEHEAHYLNLLLNQRVDGIIAAATSQPWIELAKAKVQHTPIVFVDRAYDNFDGFYVGVDNQAGAYMGTQHLIQCGYRKIGILAGLERLSTMRQRLNGYCQALQESDIEVNHEWIIPSQLSIDGGQQAMRALCSLENKPDALFINNNILALGALLEMTELNLECVNDLGIVAFDDHPWAAVSNPPLTVVRQPTQKIGQYSAEMIMALINNQPVPEKQVILSCELVERQSCQPLHAKKSSHSV